MHEIENPCYHCYMGAIGECIRCKYSENEWHGDLDALKIEISDNDENTVCKIKRLDFGLEWGEHKK